MRTLLAVIYFGVSTMVCDAELIDARSSSPVRLGDLFTTEYVLLVFIRHACWSPWHSHLAKLASQRHEFEANEATVIVIGFSDLEVSQQLIHDLQLPFPLLLDHSANRDLYRHFCFKNGSRFDAFAPMVLFHYVSAFFSGTTIRQAPPGEDIYQMGGDVLLNKRGHVFFVHRSQVATDRPNIQELITRLQECRNSPESWSNPIWTGRMGQRAVTRGRQTIPIGPPSADIRLLPPVVYFNLTKNTLTQIGVFFCVPQMTPTNDPYHM